MIASPSSESTIPRVYLDKEVDAARVVVSNEPVAKTERVEGIGFVDLDAAGNVVAVEMFRVSRQLEEFRRRQKSRPPERELDEELRLSASRLADQAKEQLARQT